MELNLCTLYLKEENGLQYSSIPINIPVWFLPLSMEPTCCCVNAPRPREDVCHCQYALSPFPTLQGSLAHSLILRSLGHFNYCARKKPNR